MQQRNSIYIYGLKNTFMPFAGSGWFTKHVALLWSAPLTSICQWSTNVCISSFKAPKVSNAKVQLAEHLSTPALYMPKVLLAKILTLWTQWVNQAGHFTVVTWHCQANHNLLVFKTSGREKHIKCVVYWETKLCLFFFKIRLVTDLHIHAVHEHFVSNPHCLH